MERTGEQEDNIYLPSTGSEVVENVGNQRRVEVADGSYGFLCKRKILETTNVQIRAFLK